MKRISNFSLLGMAIGIIFALGSFIRYYIIYNDLSEVTIGVSIGVLIFAISFMYNKLLSQEHTIDALEEYLVDKGGKK
jgi:O-antigen/teichoic acid export membrane protein